MKSAYIESRDWLAAQRWLLPVLILLGFGLAFAIPEYNLFNKYVQLVMMYVGINIILAVSLNLVNGYMGEFSLAHAGFMAVGAYTAALLSMKVLPVAAYPALFPLTILAGGCLLYTSWLAEGRAPAGFSLGDSCELREMQEAGGVVRCRGQDLTGDEISAHLAAGKQVVKLGLVWNGRIAFMLDEALIVRRLRFLEVVRESLRADKADSPEAVFDAEFALMTGELALLLPQLLEAFGGEA